MPELNGRTLSYAQAIREGLEQAMERDPNVIVIGEGVPDPKAIFGTTSRLFDRFGRNRVFDMPLSENGATGICIGAALSGLRPVMVHQRIDFALLAMDQLVNNAAKWHYMFDGKASVPLVVRLIVGRGWGQGPQHSQSLQSMFGQVPGLKVVMPTTAYDAKGMLVSAIEDNNPVLVIENRWLHHISDFVPLTYFREPLGIAKVVRQGDAVTIAAFSFMVVDALIASKALMSEMGINVEVLDMRSVRPLDVCSVVKSVKKTGRLIVADTAFRVGSIAGELVSQVVERAFGDLRAHPVCIALPDHPVPSSPFMTDQYYPSPRTIADKVIEIVGVSTESANYRALCGLLQQEGPRDTPNREFVGPF